ncbi:MAG: hypothetical protein P8074_24700 [Anaerolineales bacterium]|jgi:hypothetical protein
MPRKRHKKKPEKHALTQDVSQNEISPAARKVAQKMVGADYLLNNFERIMIDSMILADEPEFADLTFEPQSAMRTTDKIVGKSQARLERAAEQGADAHHQAIDEVRIQIIDEIATPYFRKQVFERLDRLVKRLMTGNDEKRLEIAFGLQAFLKEKSIPWGICALILTIYERTIEPTLTESAVIEEVLGDLLDELDEGQDIIEILSQASDPERMAALSGKLEANPKLREYFEQRAEKDLEKFRQALLDNKVALDVFLEEEVLLPLQRLEQELQDEGLNFSELDKQKVTERFRVLVEETIVEVMTPERLQQVKTDLEKLSQRWLRARNRWAVGLITEINRLDELEVTENPFFMLVYMNQYKRAMKKISPKKK